MKVGQLRDVLDSAARMYSETGNVSVARSLNEITRLLDGRDAMTVASFAALIEQTAASELSRPESAGIMGRLGDLFGKS
jgi:hypothetical protein